IALAHPGVYERRLPPRVGPDQKAGIGVLDASNRRIEEVPGALPRVELGAVLPTIEAGRAQTDQQLLQRKHRFGVAQVAGNCCDALARNCFEPLRSKFEGLVPIHRSLAIAADIRPVEPLADKPVDGIAGLVGNPLFVYCLVYPRQHTQHLRSPRVDPDVAADGIHHVDRLCLLQLPRASDEGIGLRCQRSDRAKIDDVGGQLRVERELDIGRDLHILATTGSAKLLDPSDLGHETNAARAMNAAGHMGFDQGAEILVADGPLVLLEPATVETVSHRLVLQIALAALVTNRAIERVIDQQEFHNSFLRLERLWRVRENHHPVGRRHRAGGDRLWRLFDFDQTHAAIAGDRKALVVAEMRDLDPGMLTGLKNGAAARHLHFAPIDRQFYHSGSLSLRCRGVAVLRDAPLHLRAEMADQALDRPRGPVGQRTDRVTFDFVRDVEQRVDFRYRGVTFNHALHHAPYPSQTLAAGCALPTALVLIEFRKPGDRLHDICRFIHDDDRSGAERALDGNEAVEIHQHGVANRFRDHRHRRTAGNDRQEIVPAAAHPARMALDQFAQRDAHRLLHIARRVHVARNAEDLGTRIPGPADPCKPSGATTQDRRHDGNCLDIVNRRRAAIESDLRWERRLQPGLTLASFQTLKEPGLFAADVSAGPAMQIKFEIPAGAAGVFAYETGVVGLVNRGLQALSLVVELAADIEVAAMHAHPDRGEQTALHKLVRVVADNIAVFASAWLALIGIDAKVGRTVALLRHEGPLQASREPGAATATQTRFLDLLDDPIAALKDQFFGAVPIAAALGAGQPPIDPAVEVGKDPITISEHCFLL